MSRLSGRQMGQLQQALVSGFSFAELSQLVQIELNEQLEAIVPSGPYSSVTFELVKWAERVSRTPELIKAMMAARPSSPEVAALAGLLGPPTTATTPVVAVADQQRRLRGLLLDQFPRPNDLKILVADALGVEIAQVAGGDNQTDVCFNLVQWLWLDKSGRLRPFLARAVAERPNSAELKALQQELAVN
jgi:hypothetical protein